MNMLVKPDILKGVHVIDAETHRGIARIASSSSATWIMPAAVHRDF